MANPKIKIKKMIDCISYALNYNTQKKQTVVQPASIYILIKLVC